MNNYESLLRGYGYAGILTSIIWILSRFKVIGLNNFEIISLLIVFIGISTFYFFSDRENQFLLLLSIFVYLSGIAFLIFLNQNKINNGRLNFDFQVFVLITFFAFGAYFLIKSFSSINKALNIILSIIFFLGIILYDFLVEFVVEKYFIGNVFSSMKIITKYIISFLFLALVIFPVRNILSALKSKD